MKLLSTTPALVLVAILVGVTAAPAAAPEASPAIFDIVGDKVEITLGDAVEAETRRGHGRGRKTGGGSVWERLKEQEQFSKFVEIVEREKGLKDEFEKGNRMTCFAPTNEAVDRMERRMKCGSDSCEYDMDDGFDYGLLVGRGRHHGDRDSRSGHHGDMDFKKVIMYHVVEDMELSRKDFFDGMLLKTSLELKELGNKPQRIRVSMFMGQISLNMYSRVIMSMHEEADNGVIWPVDNVLIPPLPLMELMLALPTKFSTSIVALHRAGLHKELKDIGFDMEKRGGDRSRHSEESGMTVLLPANKAWKALGMQNVFHLFSKSGKEDLKKIMQYHIFDELVYTTMMMKEEHLSLPTLYKGEKLEIEAIHRKSSSMDGDDEDGDEDDDDMLYGDDDDGDMDDLDENMMSNGCRRGESMYDCRRRRERNDRDHDGNNKRRHRRPSHGGRDGRHIGGKMHKPRHHVFAINGGEARIDYTDGLAENGVMHVISNVLIPKDVCMPDEMGGESVCGGRRRGGSHRGD
ncbi:hypothetical protein HK101_000647 [Irineochytrium annulatum]|nr:hypothetical protein HK101_000647 [Irineochytrium annulatum]